MSEYVYPRYLQHGDASIHSTLYVVVRERGGPAEYVCERETALSTFNESGVDNLVSNRILFDRTDDEIEAFLRRVGSSRSVVVNVIGRKFVESLAGSMRRARS